MNLFLNIYITAALLFFISVSLRLQEIVEILGNQ
jgi:hypothetical protein